MNECTYPHAVRTCVSRVYTDLAVLLLEPAGVIVRDLFGIEFPELQSLVDVPLIDVIR